MRTVIITSTNNIENAPVEKYIKPICSNIVLGVNIFSDIAAPFSDFFGGTSSSYQKKLALIYKEATENLKQEAITLGANAILSFRVDFDEISGGGKSMFIVSASGTACIIDTSYFKIRKESSKADTVGADKLRQEIYKRKIINSLKEKKAIKDDWFEFMMENPANGYIEPLVSIYISFYGNEHADVYTNRILNVLSRLEQKEVADYLFEILKEQTKPVLELISILRLVNFSNVLKLCNNKDFPLVFELIAMDAPYYNKETLEQLLQIYQILQSLFPDTGRIEIIKGGLLGKEKEVFVCQNGHKNDSDKEFCVNCGFDIKGRTIHQKKNLDILKEKIDTLSDLIS